MGMDEPTDQPIDGRMDRPMDKESYRSAIYAKLLKCAFVILLKYNRIQH
jgi:hypothetical protein